MRGGSFWRVTCLAALSRRDWISGVAYSWECIVHDCYLATVTGISRSTKEIGHRNAIGIPIWSAAARLSKSWFSISRLATLSFRRSIEGFLQWLTNSLNSLLPLYSRSHAIIRIGSTSREYRLPKALLCMNDSLRVVDGCHLNGRALSCVVLPTPAPDSYISSIYAV